MTQEVKRAYWSRFLRRFNSTNQYRPVTVSVRPNRRDGVRNTGDAPFLGLQLTRTGRKIDGVELFTGHPEPDQLNRPALVIRGLERISTMSGTDGEVHGLTVETVDGAKLQLTFEGAPVPPHTVVEKLAYALYERRGSSHGSDIADWLEAERTVRDVTAPLVG